MLRAIISGKKTCAARNSRKCFIPLSRRRFVMRKHRNKKKCDRKIVSAACMALACILLSGCRLEQPEKKHAIRIGVSLYRADDTFIGNIRSELEKRAKEYEQETGIKVTLDIQDAKGNQYVQNKQVERFISLGCDTLCVNPVDRTTSSGIIDAAAALIYRWCFLTGSPSRRIWTAGTGFTMLVRMPKNPRCWRRKSWRTSMKSDPASPGQKRGRCYQLCTAGGRKQSPGFLIRTEWSVQTLKDRGVPIEKITGGIANWERSQASALMEQWLELYPDTIELVLSNNDDMALGRSMPWTVPEERKSALWGLTELRRDKMPCRAERCWELCRRIKPAMRMLSLRLPPQLEWSEPIPGEITLDKGKYYWSRQNNVVKEKINP